MSSRKRALKITWREAWPIWLVFGLLFGFGMFGVWWLAPGAQTQAKALRPGEDVTIKTADLKPNQPTVLAYPLPTGTMVEVFVERNQKGTLTAAFASCRRCYRAGHYRQDGQIMCGHCNEPMVRLVEGHAPPAEKDCTHIPIPFEKSGDHMTLRASAVSEAFAQWYAPVVSAVSTGGQK